MEADGACEGMCYVRIPNLSLDVKNLGKTRTRISISGNWSQRDIPSAEE